MSLLMDALNSRQNMSPKSATSTSAPQGTTAKSVRKITPGAYLFFGLGGLLFVCILTTLITVIASPKKAVEKPVAKEEITSKATSFSEIEAQLPGALEESKSTAIASDTQTPEPAHHTAPQNSPTEGIFEDVVGMTAKLLSKTKDEVDSAATVDDTQYSIAYELKSSPKMLQYLENESRSALSTDPIATIINRLDVAGVMFSDAESKVLINGQVYAIGNVINKAESIQLVDITPHTLHFTDGSGRRYEKSY